MNPAMCHLLGVEIYRIVQEGLTKARNHSKSELSVYFLRKLAGESPVIFLKACEK
jgi:hypothetical protein